MIVLDTDHFSEFIKGEKSERGVRLSRRLKASGEIFCTTIVTYEEQIRGWLAKIHKSRRSRSQFDDYLMFRDVLESFEYWLVLNWDVAAAEYFSDFRDNKISISTFDLMIASITLSKQSKLSSRNLKDFSRVPDLEVEDWLS